MTTETACRDRSRWARTSACVAMGRLSLQLLPLGLGQRRPGEPGVVGPAAETERALLTARRKSIYEALHPETRRGATGRGGYKEDNLSSFSADTAAKTGVDERTVRRDATRGDCRSSDRQLGEVKPDQSTATSADRTPANCGQSAPCPQTGPRPPKVRSSAFPGLFAARRRPADTADNFRGS